LLEQYDRANGEPAPRASKGVALTLLQRRVIERLRKAGHPALADMAHHQWTHGNQIPIGDSMAIGEPHGELRADFVRANKQVRRAEL
jgi:hypothetical protein